MQFLILAFNYVSGDPYFWPSMALTSMMGIFIGAVVYNGDVQEIKKAIIALGAYALLILMTDTARIIPRLEETPQEFMNMPFAGVMTMVIITVFYLVGMLLGVKVTRVAHNGKISHYKLK